MIDRYLEAAAKRHLIRIAAMGLVALLVSACTSPDPDEETSGDAEASASDSGEVHDANTSSHDRDASSADASPSDIDADSRDVSDSTATADAPADALRDGGPHLDGSPDDAPSDASSPDAETKRADGGADGLSGACRGVQCQRNMVCTPETGTCSCFGQTCPRGTTCNRTAKRCEPTVQGCHSGSRWTGLQTTFRDASAEWNLPSIGARGVRISVTDFNGDGWADLAVREATNTPNDFASGGKRTVWLLENQKGKGFEDVTRQSNLLKRRSGSKGQKGRPAQVIVWGDVDNDGDLDAYTGFDRRKGEAEETAEIMLNQGDGTFELGPKDSDLRRPNAPDAPSGASFVDYNRDGNLDLWVSQYTSDASAAMQDRLYRGKGDGSFVDVTEKMGLKTANWRGVGGLNRAKLNEAKAHSLAWSANACDLNDDGAPELLAGSYGRAPNHLWRFDPGVIQSTYTNISIRSGYAFDDRTDWHDNASARCYCKLNPNATDCKGVPPPQRIRCQNSGDVLRWNHPIDREPFRLGGNTGTTLCADLNTDGQMDLLTNEIVHWDVGSSSDPSEILYNHKGSKIRFRRPGNKKTGLTRPHALRTWNEGDITSAVLDFDNDARPDIYIGETDYPGTRGRLWHQKPDGTFEYVKPTSGIDHRSSHGAAVADFDHDGDLDIVVGHSRVRCNSGNHCYQKSNAHVRLFENTIGQDGNWIQLDLVGGNGSNRAAIGARVEVETIRGTQTQEVDGGHGHYGLQDDTVLHFGLGRACKAEVTIHWPNQSRTTQTVTLETGARYRIEQGASPTRIDITKGNASP